MFKGFPEHKSSTFFLLHGVSNMYNLHSFFFQGVPYMHNLILLLFTGCPKHLKPFIFLFTWCTEHILSNCLHGVPNICHLHSSFNMVSQTYIIFLLMLFAWYPKNNRRCYYLHSSFTGCPKHTLSSFFFYRMSKTYIIVILLLQDVKV